MGDLQDVKLKQHTATERVRFVVQRKGRKNVDTENSGSCARSPGDRSRCAARINVYEKEIVSAEKQTRARGDGPISKKSTRV